MSENRVFHFDETNWKLLTMPEYSDNLLEEVFECSEGTSGADLMVVMLHYDLELSEWFEACAQATKHKVSIKTAILIVKLQGKYRR